MSTSRRLTCWWISAAGACLLTAIACAVQEPAKKGDPLPPFLKEFQDGRPLSSFLDDFLANTDPPVRTKEVRFPSAVGSVTGFWARQEVKQPLPAVLLVHDDDGWTEWMKTSTRHLASIGYEVLTVNVQRRRMAAQRGNSGTFTDEPTLAELSAAVRWLRGRAEVVPNRLGVVGWGWSGGQALALSAAIPVQACVICDAPAPSEAGLIVGLRETPMLGVYGGDDKEGNLPAFRKALAEKAMPGKFHVVSGAKAGFMGPTDRKTYSHDAAEDAWVVIYNFLEKHVEDARPGGAAAPDALKSVATIADIMRAVNEPAGVRGVLSKGLEQEPASKKQWERIRANAALIADAGAWLAVQPPPKGPAGHWKEQAQAFAAAAESIVHAADKRDYPAAQRGLTALAGKCAACHLEHR